MKNCIFADVFVELILFIEFCRKDAGFSLRKMKFAGDAALGYASSEDLLQYAVSSRNQEILTQE